MLVGVALQLECIITFKASKRQLDVAQPQLNTAMNHSTNSSFVS